MDGLRRAWGTLWVALLSLPTISAGDAGAVYLAFALFSCLSALLFGTAAAAFTILAMRVADHQDGPDAAGGDTTPEETLHPTP